jgi:hypothetical protein
MDPCQWSLGDARKLFEFGPWNEWNQLHCDHISMKRTGKRVSFSEQTDLENNSFNKKPFLKNCPPWEAHHLRHIHAQIFKYRQSPMQQRTGNAGVPSSVSFLILQYFDDNSFSESFQVRRSEWFRLNQSWAISSHAFIMFSQSAIWSHVISQGCRALSWNEGSTKSFDGRKYWWSGRALIFLV